jgi:outer membrane protein assembly factor BamB
MNKTMIYIAIAFTILFGSCIEKTAGEEPPVEQELALLWSYSYSNESVSLSLVSGAPTIIDNDKVLIFPDGNLTMLEIETGKENWKYPLPDGSPIVSNKITYDGQSIYVKHDKLSQGVILNKTNGTERASFDSGDKIFFDFINDSFSENELYLIGKDRNVLVFTKHGVFVKELTFDHKITSATYHNGSLITTHSYRNGTEQGTIGEIHSYDLSSDTLNWKYETDNGSYLYAPIIIENDIIYAGTTSGPSEFVALGTTDGELIWRKPDLQAWSYTLEKEAIYINDGSSIVAISKKNGRQLWQTFIPGRGHGESNIAYLNGYLYHSHSGAFFVFDAETGAILHQTVLPDGSNSRNVSAGFDKVFVQSDFHLFAYEGWVKND